MTSPTNTPSPGVDRKRGPVEIAVRVGNAASAEHRWADAADAYRYALEKDPTLSAIWIQYGHALKEHGDLERAEYAYRRSIEIEPADAAPYLDLGRVLKLRGRLNEAGAAYREALRIDRSCQAAALELDALSSPAPVPEPPAAAPTVHTATTADPVDDQMEQDDEDEDDDTDWVTAGDAANAARRWHDAELAYAKALERDPRLAAIWVQYGHALKEQGDLKRAERAYGRALALRPDDGDIQLQMGHVHKLTGRRGTAIACYRRALADPATADLAQRELALLGDGDQLAQSFEERLRSGSVDLIPVIADEITRMRTVLEQMSAVLPDTSAQTAFPVALYDRFRERYRTAAAPTAAPVALDVVLPAFARPLDLFWRQCHALMGQSHDRFGVQALCPSPEARRVIEGLLPVDSRLVLPPSSATDPSDGIRSIAETSDAEWILLLADGAVPDPQMLAWFAVAATIPGSVEAWTCDEDETHAPEGDKGAPPPSPGLGQILDYDWLLDRGARGRTIMVRRGRLRQILDAFPELPVAALRTVLLLELAWEAGLGHIPLPLTCRPAAEPGDDADHQAARDAHLARHALQERVEVAADGPAPAIWRVPEPKPLTAIVATRDNGDDVATLVDSMRSLADRPGSVSFLIIDNGSVETRSLDILKSLSANADIRVVRMDEPFNWSRLNNRAADLVSTPLVLFANDDMVMLTRGWDSRLQGLLARDDVGIVGAKLLYPDDTVQHAGMLFDWRGGTIHDGLHEAADAAGPQCRWQVTRRVSAVTGAFLATRRELFLEAGGFDEIYLQIAQSDVDYALKIRQRGLRVLWTPRIVLHHFESKSRGLDHLDAGRHARAQAELSALRSRWGKVLDWEPGMNPAYQRSTLPFRLIAPPSVTRIVDYMRASATGDPWNPGNIDA